MEVMGMFADAFQIMTFGILVVNTIGTILNSRQRASGFVIWAICNVLWACVNFYKEIYWQGVQNIIFIALNVYGILCWKYGAERVDNNLKGLLGCRKCKK
jgi:nicotinamide riboside transporter PnuC